MESRHYTEKEKRLCLVYMVCLLAVLRLCDATDASSTVSCFENEYEHNGFCCDKCHSGFKLTEKCSGKGLRSTCTKCSDETYQDHMNHFHNCFSCRKPCSLDDHEIEMQPCTNTQDRKCGCENGYYENEINDDTMSCVSCRKCETGERETRRCDGKMDRKCECIHNYYRVAPGICAPCKNCSPECSDFCKTVEPTLPIHHPTGPSIQTPVWVCLVAFIVLFCIIILYTGVQQLKKKTSYSNYSIEYDREKPEEKREPHADKLNNYCEHQLLKVDSMLPDCVPREIKTHEFIYFVLDVVPIGRFKELVRRLNVSEQDIDRAEKDNRAYADAQYQMLMVWVDSIGGKNILPRQLLQLCVETLKAMNLTASAESIDEKFGKTLV